MTEHKTATKLGVIGCGAVAQAYHFPALSHNDECKVVAVVDRDARNLRAASSMFPEAIATEDYHSLASIDVDAVILCLPNFLHSQVAIDMMSVGCDVLVEKPMARTARECEEMKVAAQDTGKILSVAMLQRFRQASRLVQILATSNALGTVRKIRVRYGNPTIWPIRDVGALDRAAAGGGTLIDLGPHVLDLLKWWFGECRVVEYLDDSDSGLELDCQLIVAWDDGSTAEIELSRQRDLGARIAIESDLFYLDVDLREDSVRLTPRAGDAAPIQLIAGGTQGNSAALIEAVTRMHDDFLSAVCKQAVPLVSSDDGLQLVHFIERCYEERRAKHFSWERPIFSRGRS